MSTVYSSLKPLLFPENLKAVRESLPIVPIHIRIKPINACNHHCWFCAYRADDLQLGDQMKIKDRIPRDKMMEIVDDIVTMGVRAVTFSGGGEPLLYPYLVETVERLARGGVQVASLTNGAFLKGDIAEMMARCATWIRVSMDGWDGPSYAKFRGVKESEFDKILNNMGTFIKMADKCALGVSFIISKRNANHIYEFCKTVKSIGVRHVKLAGCIVENDGKENNRYHSEIQELVQAQIEQCNPLNDSQFSVVNHYHEMAECFDKNYHICPFLKFLTIIGADCKVYTCQDKAYTDQGCLGSIQDRSFKEFWFSKETLAKQTALDPSKSCQHHCVTHHKNKLIYEALDLDRDHLSFV